MQYEINQALVCKGSGVCNVRDIRFESFSGKREKYYVLEPVFETCPTKIYIPVSCEKKRLRPLIRKDEIESAIASAKKADDFWLNDDKLREKSFDEIIRSSDFSKIIELIAQIHKVKSQKEKNKQKLHQTDERILKEAQKTVEDEFAYVLDITPQEVQRYIVSKLK